MNPERLAELKRQRDLIRAHLTWLEREIEAAEVHAVPSAATVPPAQRPVAESARTPLTTGLAPAADFAAALASEVPASNYEPDRRSIAQSTRRGCIVTAIAGFLLFAAILGAALFFGYRDRPLLLMDRDDGPAEKLPAPTVTPPPQK